MEPPPTDDVEKELRADLRRRRVRLAMAALAFVGVAGLAALAGLTFRERKVYLVGGSESVSGDAGELGRFRLVEPYGAIVRAMPGSHPVEAREGAVRASIEVPYAPWTSQVASPVQRGQCLIVASGSGFYEGGRPDELFVHEVTHQTRDVSLPVMTDVVASHPCQLPPSVRLLDTIAVLATVPCEEAPTDDEAARERIFAMLLSCGS